MPIGPSKCAQGRRQAEGGRSLPRQFTLSYSTCSVSPYRPTSSCHDVVLHRFGQPRPGVDHHLEIGVKCTRFGLTAPPGAPLFAESLFFLGNIEIRRRLEIRCRLAG